MRAVCLIRPHPCYRREAFLEGLRASGYKFTEQCHDPVPGDVIVIWNRYGEYETIANRWEAKGASVIVAENGYIGVDKDGIQYYALALSGHNGSGIWPHSRAANPPPDRWESLGINIKPWRTNPEHILICSQRSIGSRIMASPYGWSQLTYMHIRDQIPESTRVFIREHPGQEKPRTLLTEDLRNAQCCVIWSSGCGVLALVDGIPVFYTAPFWICSEAAKRLNKGIDEPLMDDGLRYQALTRMAFAQWSIDEIRSGLPFELLKGEKRDK